MQQYFSAKVTFWLLITAAMLCSAAMAQSGRRTHKPPASAPDAEPTPGVSKPATKQAALTLIVGMSSGDMFSGLPLYYRDSILQSFTERLRSGHSVSVDVIQRGFNRGEAVSRAKAEKDAYVVWLELGPTGYGVNRGSVNSNLNELYIQYMVFTPVTAKVKTSGNVYQSGFGRGGGVLGRGTSGPTSSAATEYRLKVAAREAADRILAKFSLPPPESVAAAWKQEPSYFPVQK